MALDQELLALEKQFWTAGPDFFRANLDDNCVVAFTHMNGVMTRDEVAATVKADDRYKDIQLEEKGLLRVDDDVAVLTYKAKARMAADDVPYEAVVSSGYARRNGRWKMVFHQQTPVVKGH